jgi:uncharacterized membrane-anchored protein YhcB (DUF1043 family)
MIFGMIQFVDLWSAAAVIITAMGLAIGGLYRAMRNWNADTRKQIKESVENGTGILSTQIEHLAQQQTQMAGLLDNARTRIARLEGHLRLNGDD